MAPSWRTARQPLDRFRRSWLPSPRRRAAARPGAGPALHGPPPRPPRRRRPARPDAPRRHRPPPPGRGVRRRRRQRAGRRVGRPADADRHGPPGRARRGPRPDDVLHRHRPFVGRAAHVDRRRPAGRRSRRSACGSTSTRSTGRPAALGEAFHARYGEAAGERRVSTRLALPGPPPDAEARPWTVRAVDLDVFDHVNNASHWPIARGGPRRDRASTASAWPRWSTSCRSTSTRPSSCDRRHRRRGGRAWLVADGRVHTASRWRPPGGGYGEAHATRR